MKRLNLIFLPLAFLFCSGCHSTEEALSFSVKRSIVTQDTMSVILPEGMTPEQAHEQGYFEKLRKERIEKIESSGDTIYYVKSVNGLDSAFVKVPKGLPDHAKKALEEHVRQQLSNPTLLNK